MTFEEELDTHGGFLFTNVGDSMKPMIRQGRDVLEITARPEGRLKKYDIPLYKAGDRYILHRILQVREHDYLIAGDHNYSKEIVTESQIIGMLTGLTRDGRQRKLSGPKYRLYLFFWCDLFPIRATIRFLLTQMRRVLGRMKRAIKEGRG